MWKAYHQISETRYPQDITPYEFPFSISERLKESLTTIGKKHKISLEGAVEYFSEPKNPNFHKDTLDPNKIDFRSFQTRLSNFLLEKIHKQGSYNEPIHEFLYSSYREREEAKGKSVESDSDSSEYKEKKEDEADDKIFLSDLTSEVVDEIRKEKPVKEKKEKKLIEKKVSEKKIPILKHKWTSQTLETYKTEIEQLFKTFKTNGKIKAVKLQDLCKSTLSKLNLYLDEEDFQDFRKVLENNFCHPENNSKKSFKLEFSDLTQALTLWGEKYNESRSTLKGKLQKSVQKYSNLLLQYSDYPKISPILSKLKQKLQVLIQKFPEHSLKNDMQQVIKKNLEEIFLFYAKSQKIQGVKDTFEGMESSNTSWNLGKFLRFCQDFEITGEKTGIPKDQLVGVFKKVAINVRIMDLDSFFSGLGKIAECFYNPQYDKDHGTDLAMKSVEEKKEMLFKMMDLDKVNSYVKRAKGFNVPHTPKDKVRIPKSHLKKLKFDYQLPESFIKQVESWKNRKFHVHNVSPSVQIQKSGLNAMKHVHLRRSSGELQSPRQGYAKKMKRKGQHSQLNPLSIQKKELFSDDEQEGDEQEDEDEAQEKTGKIRLGESMGAVVKIQDLSKMDFEDFDESDIRDFITDEQDDYFDKIYKIEPRLQGILKMHQDKVAKGIKVIGKSKGIYSERKLYK